MSTETTTEVTTPTSAPAASKPTKKVVKKTAAKKAATKKPTKKGAKTAASGETGDIRKDSTAHLVLKLIDKKPMSRTQLSEKLDGAWVGSKLMGHHDPAQTLPSSLVGRKFAKAEKHDVDGRDVILYSITAAGKKALEALK